MKKEQFSLLILVAFILFGTQSCVKYREMVALNGADKKPNLFDGQTLYESEVYPYQAHLIRPYDQLMIKVNAFEGSTEEFLNREFKTENTYSRDISFDPPSLYFNTYTVDETGYLYLPVIDSIYCQRINRYSFKGST